MKIFIQNDRKMALERWKTIIVLKKHNGLIEQKLFFIH